MIRNLLVVSTLLAPSVALAQTLPTAPYLPLELAEKGCQCGTSGLLGQGNAVTVAIVARDGAVKTVLKADGSGPHTVSSATGKAFAAASLGRDIGEIAEFIASSPPMMASATWMSAWSFRQAGCRSRSATRSSAVLALEARRRVQSMPNVRVKV